MKKIISILSSTNADFVNSRIDAITQLRSILISCRDQDLYLAEYMAYLKPLHEPLKTQIKEQRSVVVRQISTTVWYDII
jgi:hypothetical protein